MQLKLFGSTVSNQLNRLFGSTTFDAKNAYLISLASGKTIKDLNTCLNFQAATGAGYVFDTTRLASQNIGTLLGSSTDCVRTIANNILSVSEMNITANVAGKPTHIVLGGIVPLALEIGTDINVLYPDSNTVIDVTSVGSIVYCPQFNVSLPGLIALNSWLAGNEFYAVDSSVFRTGSFTDYTGSVWTVGGDIASAGDGVAFNTNGSLTSLATAATVIDVTKSFTVDFKYRQDSTTAFPDVALFGLYGSSLNDRYVIGLEPTAPQFGLWNNLTTSKVSRPIANYNAMRSTTFVDFKYVYDASTNLHRVFINGTLVDSWTYVPIKPVTTQYFMGGGNTRSIKVVMTNMRARQGVFL